MVDDQTELAEMIGKCDVCGEPAAMICVDVAKWPNYETGHMDSEPLGPTKRGCAKHPVRSIKHEFERKP